MHPSFWCFLSVHWYVHPYNIFIMFQVYSTVYSVFSLCRIISCRLFKSQMKENIKAPYHWPLCREFTGNRWIPRTKDQLRKKCFHLMMSSCHEDMGKVDRNQTITNDGKAWRVFTFWYAADSCNSCTLVNPWCPFHKRFLAPPRSNSMETSSYCNSIAGQQIASNF